MVRNALGKFPVVHHAIRSVWTPPESIFQHLHFEGAFTVEVAPGARFRLEAHGEQVENDLFWRGFGNGWEGKSLQLWRELVGSADFIADVGANTGVYALAAQALRPTAKVLAVEPSARVFDKLRRNIALNGFPIIALDCAVSDKSGQATFYDCAGPHQYSASLELGMGGNVEVVVAVERLDDLLPKHGFERLDLMKLDVELHEPAALRGLRATLERCRPTMLVEIIRPEIEAELRSMLEPLGYRFERIDEMNVLIDPGEGSRAV